MTSDASASASDQLRSDQLQARFYADSFFAERYDRESWAVLGSGAFAVVVRVHCNDRDGLVALKLLRNLDNPARFRSEVLNAQRVVSQYIVQAYSPFVRGELAWIEMEYIDGPDLGQAIQERDRANNPFSIEEALPIAIAIGEAIQAAHHVQVLHRDLKPANILLPRTGVPPAKLGDFGISRFTGANSITATGDLLGTPWVTSPEAFNGDTLGPKHDVYCLGLCLYLLFTGGRYPWQFDPDPKMEALAYAHTSRIPMPPSEFHRALRGELDDVLLAALRKKADGRPSIDEMVARLKNFNPSALQSTPAAAPAIVSEPVIAAPAPAPAKAVPIWLPIVLAAAVIAGALVLRTPGPAASASPTPAVSAPTTTPATVVSPAVVARVEGDFLLLEVGPDPLTDIKITLRSATRTHTYVLRGAVEPRESPFLTLSEFDPPAAAGRYTEVTVAYRRHGTAGEVTIPLAP